MKILCVEDDSDIRMILKMALVRGGHKVQLCESSREAVAMATTYRPDLILLDVMMPEMDGTAVLGLIRKTPDIAATPVIFTTAQIQADDVDRYKSMGAIGVIAKPFDPIALPAMVANLLSPEIATLRREYRDKLPLKVRDIRELWHALRHAQHDADRLHSLYRLTHNLTGSGTSFGCTEISTAANRVQSLLKTLSSRDSPPTPEEVKRVDAAIETLEKAATPEEK